MPPPGDKPKSAPSSGPTAEEQAIIADLGLEETIKDEAKREAVARFIREKRESEVKLEGKSLREKFAEQFRGKDAEVQTYLDFLIKESVRSAREVNVKGKYAEQFWNKVQEEGVDLEGDDDDKTNSVYLAALNLLQNKIRRSVNDVEDTTNKYVKQDAVHQYATAAINDFVKKMDAKAENAIAWGVLEISELTGEGMQIMDFAQWKNQFGPPDSEVFFSLSPAEAQVYAKESQEMQKAVSDLETAVADFDSGFEVSKFKEFFEGKLKEIQGYQADDPNKAVTEAQKYLAGITTVKAVDVLKKSLTEQQKAAADAVEKVSNFDATIKEGYDKASQDLADALKAYMEGSSSGDADKLEKARQQVEKAKQELDDKMKPVQEAAGEAAEGEKTAEEAKQLLENPSKMLEKMAGDSPWLLAIFSFLGLDKYLAKWMDKAKTMTPIYRKADKMMREGGFQRKERGILLGMKVGDIMKLNASPDGVDYARFKQLQADLEGTNAVDKPNEALAEFIMDKDNGYKAGSGVPGVAQPGTTEVETPDANTDEEAPSDDPSSPNA